MRFRVPLLPFSVTLEKRRLDPPRWRVRTILIGIAIIAVALNFGLTWRKWSRYARMARYHATEEQGWAESVESTTQWMDEEAGERDEAVAAGRHDESEIWSRRVAVLQESIEELRQRIAYHAMMKTQYRAAARRPWVLLDADLPQPPVHLLNLPNLPDPKPVADKDRSADLPPLPPDSSPFDH